jgi:hypothetical protein
LEILKESDHLGDLDVGGRTILKLNFKKRFMRVWTGLMWLRIVSIGGLL